MSTWQDLLGDTKLIPVVVIDNEKDALPLAEAILEGGINVIEVTFRTAAAFNAIKRIRENYPEMLMGAGTVVTHEHAKQALDAGVHFGLAPGLNPETVETFHYSDTLFIPGVATASEVEKANALGCRLLKFFPAEEAGGARMLKALSMPYAHLDIHFCPTSGINIDSMNDYLALPTVAAIGGSWLATRDDIATRNWGAITNNVREALKRIQH